MEQRWIPVKVKLPEPRIDVWVNSDLGQMVAYYDETIGTWYGRDYLELLVDAWMPISTALRTGMFYARSSGAVANARNVWKFLRRDRRGSNDICRNTCFRCDACGRLYSRLRACRVGNLDEGKRERT